MERRFEVDRRALDDAHAVFLPAIDEQSLPVHISEHLDAGGTSVLVAQSRAEYVARGMSNERRVTETTDWFERFTSMVRSAAHGRALIAVDQEVGGIQRLHGLASRLPTGDEFSQLSTEEVESLARRLARDCSALGVNVVLSPIVDVVTGSNPWLEGRTVSSDLGVMRRTSPAFVRGLQSSGRVAATAKHFPGHPNIPLDPAVEDQAYVEASLDEIDLTIEVFRAVVEAGVRVVMAGPALVPAMDANHPASRSSTIVGFLRRQLGFGGVVLSDGLDAPGILRGGSVEDAAVAALRAGVDWLLVPGSTRLPGLVTAVTRAVECGDLDAGRLHDAAEAVRRLAHDLT